VFAFGRRCSTSILWPTSNLQAGPSFGLSADPQPPTERDYGQKFGCHTIRMILLKRGVSENCGSSSDPRPDVKRGSAFGRSYEASPMQQGKSREISSPGYTGQVGLLDDNNMAGWKPRRQLVQKRKCSTALQAFQPTVLLNDGPGICRIIAVNDTNSNCTCSDFFWCSDPLGAILAHPNRDSTRDNHT